VVPEAVLHYIVGAESVDGHAHRGRRAGLGVDPKVKGELLRGPGRAGRGHILHPRPPAGEVVGEGHRLGPPPLVGPKPSQRLGNRRVPHRRLYPHLASPVGDAVGAEHHRTQLDPGRQILGGGLDQPGPDPPHQILGVGERPRGVEDAYLVDEVAGVALPVGALVPDPDRDPLVEPHRLPILLVGGRASRRGDRAVAVGDDAQVGVAAGDAREVRLLCTLVTAAEVLKQHRRRPELGDHRRQQPALGGQLGHHAGDEHRLGLRPGPQLVVGEPAGRRHPVDDRGRLRPRDVHGQALADLDRSSTEPTGPGRPRRQRPDSGCDVPTGYGTRVP
jgi:hypothetical protein